MKETTRKEVAGNTHAVTMSHGAKVGLRVGAGRSRRRRTSFPMTNAPEPGGQRAAPVARDSDLASRIDASRWPSLTACGHPTAGNPEPKIPQLQVVGYKHCRTCGLLYFAAARVAPALGNAGLVSPPNQPLQCQKRCLTAARQIVCYDEIAVRGGMQLHAQPVARTFAAGRTLQVPALPNLAMHGESLGRKALHAP